MHQYFVLISQYGRCISTSKTPMQEAHHTPACQRLLSRLSVADTMAHAYVSTAAFLNAGLDSRRCRVCTSPSLTSKPFPVRLLPVLCKKINQIVITGGADCRQFIICAATINRYDKWIPCSAHLPGKNAVPFLPKMLASSMSTCAHHHRHNKSLLVKTEACACVRSSLSLPADSCAAFL